MNQGERRFIRLPNGEVIYLDDYPEPDLDEEELEPELRAYIKYHAQQIARLEDTYNFNIVRDVSNIQAGLLNDHTTALHDLESRVTRLSSTIFDLHSQIATLSNTISRLESTVNRLDSQVVTLYTMITDLRSQIADIQTQIQNLPGSWLRKFRGWFLKGS